MPTTRTGRHRNPHTHDEQHPSSEPFFSKTGKTAVQQKAEPFFPGKAGTVQAKLSIGQPNDQYEREADAVAEKVVSQPGNAPGVQQKKGISSIQRLATPMEDEKLGTNDARMAKDKEIQEKSDPVAAGNKEEEKPVQKMDEPKEEEKTVQAKADGSGATTSRALGSRIESAKGSGKPLPRKSRSEMESSIGADFRSVRIHTDNEAAEMNRELGAQAFTHGRDIYFNRGKYNPDSTEGKRLLAHELTHVVQQEGGMKQIQNKGDAGGSSAKKSDVDAEATNIPQDADASVETQIDSSPVKKLKKIWKEKGKDAFFEGLRQLTSQERLNVALHEFVAQTLIGNDLWLAQNILKHGVESGWPVALKVERVLTGLDDSLGLEAALTLINSATIQQKFEILGNKILIEKIRDILNFDNVQMLQTELKLGIRQLLAKEIVSIRALQIGPIRDATGELLISPDVIDQNTALHLLRGDILAYYIDDLLQPENVDNFTVSKGYNPKTHTFYYEPPENTNLMFVQKSGNGFQHPPNKIFVKRTATIETVRDTLVHETNHALNIETTTNSPEEIIERYKSEFRAFWVSGFRDVTDEGKKAQHLKNEILDKYPTIKSYYDSYPEVKTAIDNHVCPDGNLINR